MEKYNEFIYFQMFYLLYTYTFGPVKNVLNKTKSQKKEKTQVI